MAGISSRAVGSLVNKYKYNGIEFENDLDIDIYDAFYRELDPQIGRWLEIDPKIDDMLVWSPYVANFDNPIRFDDYLGDEPESSNCCPNTIALWQSTRNSASNSGPYGKPILIVGAVATAAVFFGEGSASVVKEIVKIGGEIELKNKTKIEAQVYSTTFAGTSLALDNYKVFAKVTDASKNEKHGDGGKAKTKSETQIDQLREKLKNATGRLKKQIEQKIKNINKDAAKKKKGEEHSRIGKQ